MSWRFSLIATCNIVPVSMFLFVATNPTAIFSPNTGDTHPLVTVPTFSPIDFGVSKLKQFYMQEIKKFLKKIWNFI